jgi:hypothetical protein
MHTRGWNDSWSLVVKLRRHRRHNRHSFEFDINYVQNNLDAPILYNDYQFLVTQLQSGLSDHASCEARAAWRAERGTISTSNGAGALNEAVYFCE